MGAKDRIKALNAQATAILNNDAVATSGSGLQTSNSNSDVRSRKKSLEQSSPPIIAANVNDENLISEKSVSEQQGVEILDSAISATSTVSTHKLDKKHVQVDSKMDSSSAPPIFEGQDHDLENGRPVVDETKVEEEIAVATDENDKVEAEPYDETKNDSLLPMTHVDPLQQDSTPDDVSSLHHSIAEEEKSSAKGSQVEQALPVHYEEEDSLDEYAEKAMQRRRIFIILLLVIFLGLVCAIGAGIVLALKNRPPKVDKYNGVGGGIDQDDVFATDFPSSAPSYGGLCIGLEVGIIFDEYATETSWKLLLGETDEVIWQSDYYGSSWDSDWDVFHKCFPAGMYTFVFMDKEGDGICCSHGEGKYVLSSEGKIIAVGGQMINTKEERTVFELEYVEPEPTDSNGDGLDDRLGILMPYDSSNLVEGETCENFRLVFETDQYGIETGWELYEGSVKVKENIVANGTSYGSNHTYVVDYCLPSQKSYLLYMYDWKGDGLCCEYGNGWFKVTSGDITIYESDGKFGTVDEVQFDLPADGTFIATPAPIVTSSPTQPPTPLPTPLPPPPPSLSPTLNPTPNPTNLPPVTSVSPTIPPTLRSTRASPPPFTLPFITIVPTEVVPTTQITTLTPTESITITSTASSVSSVSSSPTLQTSTSSTETNICSFCLGVEMKNPNLELPANQTCQSVQDKANTLTADDSSCVLLQLVEEKCCRPR